MRKRISFFVIAKRQFSLSRPLSLSLSLYIYICAPFWPTQVKAKAKAKAKAAVAAAQPSKTARPADGGNPARPSKAAKPAAGEKPKPKGQAPKMPGVNGKAEYMGAVIHRRPDDYWVRIPARVAKVNRVCEAFKKNKGDPMMAFTACLLYVDERV